MLVIDLDRLTSDIITDLSSKCVIHPVRKSECNDSIADRQFLPMQVGKADWQAVQQGPPWAVDAWGLGCLIQEVYRGAVLTRTEELRDTSSIPKNVLPVGHSLH